MCHALTEFAIVFPAYRNRTTGLIAAISLACMACAAPAQASVPWHADVAQAKAASVISHRPVLVVFTAKWSDASLALEQTTLANTEAMALVTACFEPVKIDVDADPETTRRLGVSYLPTACVIDLDDRVLATFDCPDNPASFVAAAGRAAQDAAAAKAAAQPGHIAVAAATPVPPRNGSDFAAAGPRTTATPTAHTSEPQLPASPPAGWPAERAASPTAATAAAPSTPPPSSTPPAMRPNIEPAPTTTAAPASGMVSWLGQQAAAAAPAAPSAPALTAAPTAAPAAQPTTAPAKPADEGKPKQANPFIAALQKPFALLPKWPGTGNAKPAVPAAAPVAVAAAPADTLGSMPLGLEGYCPVTLVERGAWVEGRAQFGARHRGRTYLFAGAEQQQAFLTDPDRYAPALSGDDPVLAFDAGKTVPGQRRFGVTYQSRVYLFSSTETQSAFSADPQKYTARVAVAEGRSPMTGPIQR
jgi:YHS domain-containing protein